MTEKRGCLTCRHARYEKTPTGKPKRNQPVLCLAPVPPNDAIVAALKPFVPASMLSHFYHQNICAFGMWIDSNDGSECPTWKSLTDVPRGAADDGGNQNEDQS